jgi:4-hydroxy-tetrahydrodipicolinate reductase
MTEPRATPAAGADAIRLAVAGCCGRMGRAVLRLAAEAPDFHIVAALTIPEDPALGADAGVLGGVAPLGVAASCDPNADFDVLIDFTAPAGVEQWSAACAARGAALVSGVTALTEPAQAALRRAAERTAVLWAPNMSMGVNLLIRMARELAARVPDWDIEIVEAHHGAKLDAPSGTARALLEAVCQGRKVDPSETATYGRQGHRCPRKTGEVGVHALRLGGVVGDHDVHFATSAETLTLRHHAASRDVFAAGALHAARWLCGRPPGLYTMADVLG